MDRRLNMATTTKPVAPRADPAEYRARWWHLLEDGRMQCDLCPRDCRLHEGQRGACFVRQRTGDEMILTTTNTIEGRTITAYKGIVVGEAIMGAVQPRVQVLPELGHLQIEEHGPAG